MLRRLPNSAQPACLTVSQPNRVVICRAKGKKGEQKNEGRYFEYRDVEEQPEQPGKLNLGHTLLLLWVLLHAAATHGHAVQALSSVKCKQQPWMCRECCLWWFLFGGCCCQAKQKLAWRIQLMWNNATGSVAAQQPRFHKPIENLLV